LEDLKKTTNFITAAGLVVWANEKKKKKKKNILLLINVVFVDLVNTLIAH